VERAKIKIKEPRRSVPNVMAKATWRMTVPRMIGAKLYASAVGVEATTKIDALVM
jgi:hypothetical protein